MNKTGYLKLEKTKSGLSDKFRALREEQLPWYEQEALKHFGLKRLPQQSADDFIRQSLGKSPNDDNRKRKTKQYYVANVVGYLSVMNKLLNDKFLENFEKQEEDKLVVYNYHRVIRNLLFDSLVLLNEFSCHVLKDEPKYGCGKGYQQHSMTIYQSLRQSIYGQASFHSFIEVQPDLSISLIRQLVELRLRRAFGVLGWYDANIESLEPLPLGALLEVLKRFEKDIDFSMPLDCLIRIYGWSNIFMHTGFKDCSWKHIFVTDYIAEFAMGKREKMSVKSGISLSADVQHQIVKELEKNHPKGAKILRCEPEAAIKGKV